MRVLRRIGHPSKPANDMGEIITCQVESHMLPGGCKRDYACRGCWLQGVAVGTGDSAHFEFDLLVTHITTYPEREMGEMVEIIPS